LIIYRKNGHEDKKKKIEEEELGVFK